MPKSPEMSRPEQKESREVAFEAKDIEALEEALTTKMSRAERSFDENMESWEKRSGGRTFEEALARTADGAGELLKTPREYGDDHVIARGNDEILDLALDSTSGDGQVYDNLMFLLNGHAERKEDKVLDNIAIRKLMESNEKLNRFIMAVIEGAKKCDDKKKERNKGLDEKDRTKRIREGEIIEKNILG